MRVKLTGAVACALISMQAAAQSVLTYHNGINRHGEYTVPGLTAAAAAGVHRDPNFDGTITGNMYAQPLYWKPAGASSGQVIVASEANVVEALDDTTGKVVWQTALPAAVPVSALGCGNIDPEGITGTPAIDPGRGAIYLDALVDQAPAGVRHRVYGLSVTTGKVLPGWPIDVQAALAARGVAFDSTIQGERGAVLVLGDNIYIAYGGRFGDCGSYHGTVVQLKAAQPALVASWMTRGERGGIWAQGGTASDGQSIFATTGNTSNATSWADGEGILRLSSGLAHSASAADYFTPSNWQLLDTYDEDLGGTEALPFTVHVDGGSPARRLIAFGKDGNAYLVDRDNMGGIGGALAVVSVSTTRIITAPAIYNAGGAAMVVFRNGGGNVCTGTSLSMLSIASGTGTPIREVWCAPLSGAGAPIVTTTDGRANPLVWVTGAEGDDLLHGFDAMTGTVVFAGAGTAMTGLRHFGTILAANQRLYVAADGKIYAFVFN